MALDPQQIADRVRFLLGDPSEEIISEELLLQIVNDCITVIGNEDENYCKVVQCALFEALRYLIRKYQVGDGAASGVKKRKEKIGQREVEVEYQNIVDVQSASGWQQMYDDYKRNPEWICKELAGTAGKYLVTIGGTSQEEYDRVNGDTDSRNGWEVETKTKYSFRNSRKQSLRLQRSKYGRRIR
ncbi:head completion adaptor [Vibrio phage 1.063.O._10N.261.45.C7]|nr:head completion adaptor [Vibrio phage 1.063.O._10N.261.45.C7]